VIEPVGAVMTGGYAAEGQQSFVILGKGLDQVGERQAELLPITTVDVQAKIADSFRKASQGFGQTTRFRERLKKGLKMTRFQELGRHLFAKFVRQTVGVLVHDHEVIFFQRLEGLGYIELKRSSHFVLSGHFFEALERFSQWGQTSRKIKERE